MNWRSRCHPSSPRRSLCSFSGLLTQRAAALRSTIASLKVLQDELARVIEGEARFDAGTRALYSTDASNYRRVPIGVVILLKACRTPSLSYSLMLS
jgi:hypothetical protein